MERDPFLNQIVERLNGHLDEYLFQVCVGDLLGSIYPGLVPFRGGDDAGMDGAIPDGEGAPYPLIVTTGKDALGNLTRNLKSYISDGGRRRKVVFATSRTLTPRRIQNLYKGADELGFTLINVHPQDSIAKLLYRNPIWCRDLLGLTGNPAPLSTVPLSVRPLMDQDLVGRDPDFAWLKDTTGDRFLVGQPGSGKTFLLYKFAQEGEGLFVISSDRGEIANWIRAQQPTVLIVDDAHLKTDLLASLKQMRQDLGFNFSILASSWPNEADRISEILNFPTTQIHYLDLLNREQIVKVIKHAGITGPNDLVRELVNQSEGRPGLAVILTHICLSGDIRSVISGEALQHFLVNVYSDHIAERLRLILASFSLGGEAGMTVELVSNYLELGRLDIAEALSKLAPSGVIQDRLENKISVRPPAFRHALVRDVFFNRGSRSLDIKPLIDQSPASTHTVRTLIGAKARGANVPDGLILELLEYSGSSQAWIEYAWLGKHEVRTILIRHPELLLTIAKTALEYDPGTTIPLLLDKSIEDQRPLHSNPDQPIRIIADWIHAGYEPPGEAVRRRGLLLDSLREWLLADRNPQVLVHALRYALSPRLETHFTDPGFGNTVSLVYGMISQADLDRVINLWPKALELLVKVKDIEWGFIQDLVGDWAYPKLVIEQIRPETESQLMAFASQMLRDLLAVINKHPGAVQWAIGISSDLGVVLPFECDSIYEILFPDDDLWRKEVNRDRQDGVVTGIESLAQEWSNKHPVDVAGYLNHYEHEAIIVRKTWPRNIPVLCEKISMIVDSPTTWGLVFLNAGMTPDILEPFLAQAANKNEPGWIEFASQCFDREHAQLAATMIILRNPSPPPHLLDRSLVVVNRYHDLVEALVLRGEVPSETIKCLLSSGDLDVARAAAYGEWLASPEKTVRPELYDAWLHVIISDYTSDYWLEDIFHSSPDIAYQWIEGVLSTPEIVNHSLEKSLRAAVEQLDTQKRIDLLEKVDLNTFGFQTTLLLVSGNIAVYKALLENTRLKDIHLYPFIGNITDEWIDKAIFALDNGYKPEEIAHAVHGIGMTAIVWFGKESNEWSKKVEQFKRLTLHEDPRIRRIGEICLNYAVSRYERAKNNERLEEIYGLDHLER